MPSFFIGYSSHHVALSHSGVDSSVSLDGDDAISLDRGIAFLRIGGDSAREELMNSLAKIRRNALRELKEAAYDLGCNAVIGVDFDYITLYPQTHNIGGGTKLQPTETLLSLKKIED